MDMKFLFFLLSTSLLLISCEKDISFNIENQPPKLVVDGQIEQGEAPIIVLTKSANFFNTLSAAEAARSFVRNAVVSVNNGTKTHILKEYVQPVGGGINFYYYSNDIANPATSFIGENGKTYTLTIQAGGETYTAKTLLPIHARTIDSLWWQKAPFKDDSTRAFVFGRFSDPPGLGNYIRYFMKVNRGVFLPGENSSFDDQVVDGKRYDVQIDPGLDRNLPAPINPNERESYKRGDTVTIKLCNIDKASYDFWNTLEFSYQSVGNPFSAPNKVLGNISNNALGVFCGYSVQTKTIILK